jgi:hypothetical protein
MTTLVGAALEKGGHKYAVLVDADNPELIAEAYRQFGRWAASKEFNADWYDAAELCNDLKQALEAGEDVQAR